MSENESITAVRATIPELNGRPVHEAYQFFREKLGEAEEVDEWEDKVENFHYDESHAISVVHDNKLWGVQVALSSGSDGDDSHEDVNVELEFLETIKLAIIKKFPSATNFMLASYTWYNGVDEPVKLVPSNPKIDLEDSYYFCYVDDPKDDNHGHFLICSKKFWEKNKCMDDSHISDEVHLPEFNEVQESVFCTTDLMSADTAKAILKGRGFIENMEMHP